MFVIVYQTILRGIAHKFSTGKEEDKDADAHNMLNITFRLDNKLFIQTII